MERDHLTVDVPSTASGSLARYEPPELIVLGTVHELTLQVCDPSDPTCISDIIP
jgi:hypothetical protein